MKEKLFVIKKYVKATSASAAIRKEKTIAVDDVWIDDEWRKSNTDRLTDLMGFTVRTESSDDLSDNKKHHVRK